MLFNKILESLIYIVLMHDEFLQVSVYITEGLERARDGLSEAAGLRERFVLGTLSRRVAAAAASAVITLSHYLKVFIIPVVRKSYL